MNQPRTLPESPDLETITEDYVLETITVDYVPGHHHVEMLHRELEHARQDMMGVLGVFDTRLRAAGDRESADTVLAAQIAAVELVADSMRRGASPLAREIALEVREQLGAKIVATSAQCAADGPPVAPPTIKGARVRTPLGPGVVMTDVPESNAAYVLVDGEKVERRFRRDVLVPVGAS